jgi:hypothetical protein
MGIKDPKDPLDVKFLVDLPENVRVDTLARSTDLKSTWRTGVRKLEECFSDILQRMNIQFDEKAMEFDGVREQIVTNHEFLKRFYLDMQKRLNDKYDKILDERARWEKEKAEIAALVNMDSEVIALNVGGTAHLMTERDVLRHVPGSTLEKMFNGMHELKKIDGEVFLDRDGKTFQYLVNYLRNKRQVFPEFIDYNDEKHFFKELDFWKIPVKEQMKKPRPPSQSSSTKKSPVMERGMSLPTPGP